MKSIKVEITPLDGVNKISSEEWDGEILRMSRKTFNKHKNKPFLDRAGIYVIYADHYDRASYGNEIYVGQGDDVRQRLSDHLDKKPFWNKVLIFTSEKMNVAIAFNVEKEFIFLAKLANKYTVTNGDKGQRKKLGSDDEEYMKNYVNQSIQALSLSGNELFTINSDGHYLVSGRDTHGVATLIEGDLNKIRILKGSKFSFLRDESNFNVLFKSGVVKKNDRGVEFLKDYIANIENGALPFLIDPSIYLRKFVNSCGIKLSKAVNVQ